MAHTRLAPRTCRLPLTRPSQGKKVAALDKFMEALELGPNNEEKKAALYNAACCYASFEQSEDAVDALREALDCGLRYSTILADADLATLRGTAEFAALKAEVVEGGNADGGSFRRDLKLINEARSPFRPVRGFLYVALGLAAFLSTLFTLPRLGAALSGEEGVTLLGVLQNLGINVAGLIAIFFLWRRDQEGEAKEIDTLTVEETLSRLPVAVGSGGSNERIVQLCDLRSNARPVVLAGSDRSVRAAVAAAGKYKAKLEERGLVLVPFVIGSSTALEEQQRKGFGAKAKKLTERVAPEDRPAARTEAELAEAAAAAAKDGGAGGDADDDFDAKVAAAAARAKLQASRRFRADPPAASLSEWERFVEELQSSTDGVGRGDDCFLVLRLDGRLRASGKGMPDWERLIEDVPKSTELVSKLES